MTGRASRSATPVRSTHVGLPPFQSFLEGHRDHVYRFLVAMVGRQEAEDCFQETFLAALRAYPQLRDGSNLRSWVMTIAHRKAIDAMRGRARRPMPVETVPELAATGEQPGDGLVWEVAATLPARQRAALVLRYAIGMRYAEIGSVLGSSDAAARQNVHEATKRLREVLA